MKVNGFVRIVTQDGIVKDGVLQSVSDVLIPPKKIGGGHDDDAADGEEDEELTVASLKERLAPYVDEKENGEMMNEL